eukprot:TRINITY_DN1499_c0_g1_i3.p1 TRINITY_DN1499_c0_g1~~TRINITY_DN1499_c0_g1_i3.p1  ORF type:complete len:100 (-),score=11.60 TRINITY_DN1499_c0_g1_i3:307-606(-)
MLLRLNLLCNEVLSYLMAFKSGYCLKQDEWRRLSELEKLLELFYNATVALSYETLNSSFVLPLLQLLRSKLIAQPKPTSQFIQTILEGLKVAFAIQMEK